VSTETSLQLQRSIKLSVEGKEKQLVLM